MTVINYLTCTLVTDQQPSNESAQADQMGCMWVWPSSRSTL